MSATLRESSDFPVDVVVLNDNGDALSVQVKGIAIGGLTCWRKYVGLNLVIAYVRLSRREGGSHDRTSITVIPPEVIWQLPTTLGLARDVEGDNTYRWARSTAALTQALEPYTAHTPAELGALLRAAMNAEDAA